jgi:ribulose-phosphate 3-epimerase
MIVDPIRYIDDFVRAGADLITFHYESTDDVDAVIDAIRAKGVKVGISISPETDVKVLMPYIEKVDMVLIMTVRPGFGGQKFMADMMDKVRFVRDFATERGLDLDIQVDGGVSDKNTDVVCAAGANVLVAGSAIFGAPDPAEVAKNMKKIGNETFKR